MEDQMVNCRTILCSQGEDDHFLSSRKWSTPIWTNPNWTTPAQKKYEMDSLTNTTAFTFSKNKSYILVEEIWKLKMRNPTRTTASSKSYILVEDRNGVQAARQVSEQTSCLSMWLPVMFRNPMSTLLAIFVNNWLCWKGGKKNSPPIGAV